MWKWIRFGKGSYLAALTEKESPELIVCWAWSKGLSSWMPTSQNTRSLTSAWLVLSWSWSVYLLVTNVTGKCGDHSFSLKLQNTPLVLWMRGKTHAKAQSRIFWGSPTQRGSIVMFFLIILDHSVSEFIFPWDDRLLVLHYSYICGMVKLPKWSIVKFCTSSARMHTSDGALESSWWVAIISSIVGKVPVSWGAG